MDKSKSFNIVIYPPEEILQKAIKLSKQFQTSGGSFVLGRKNCFPHITLYMTEFPLKNLKKIKKVLKYYTSKIRPFNISSLKYRQNKDGYIDICYKNKKLKELQKNIVVLLNPLREELVREKDKLKIKKLNKKQQKNILLYGYRHVGAEFYPHLTFTKLEKFDKKILSKIPKNNFSFKANRIALFYLGEYGTCSKLVEVFNFI